MVTVRRTDTPQASFERREAIDRVPPHSIEAEKAVLGSILILPDTCDEVVGVVRADDFYSPAHQKLYHHIVQMHDAGSRIDVTLLHERLKNHGDLEEIGGVAYLAEIAQAVPTAAHAVHYAEIVRSKAILRGLIQCSTDILRDAYDPSADPREQLNKAEERMLAIRDSRDSGDIVSLQEALHEALTRIDQRKQHGGTPGCVRTRITDFDNLTGGLHPGELVILAGRPGMGKTALATTITEHAALHEKAPTLFVSLEMSRYELIDRMLCSYAKVNSHRLRTGTIGKEEVQSLVHKAAELSQASLFVDDTPSRTMTEIAAAARRLKRRHGIKLIIIDYLQLIAPDDPREPRQEQVARIARRLKGLAREVEVPVLCLAQLNRQAEQGGRDGHRPKLSHLRESGAIEQDADMVMFVHRDEYYETDPQARAELAGNAEIIIAKQRNGPIGEVKVVWMHEYTRFEDRSLEWQSDGGF